MRNAFDIAAYTIIGWRLGMVFDHYFRRKVRSLGNFLSQLEGQVQFMLSNCRSPSIISTFCLYVSVALYLPWLRKIKTDAFQRPE